MQETSAVVTLTAGGLGGYSSGEAHAIRGRTLNAFFAVDRDLTGIQWPEENKPPSFHELRSLSARLYAEQGISAQALLEHKSADMTAIYRDTLGAEWIEVKTA